MKAIIFDNYGPPDVLKVKEVKTPSPRDDEILIRVKATPIGYGDLLVRNLKNSFHMFNMPYLFWIISRILLGINKPKKKILGSELAGIIEATGKDITLFKKGDQVFAYPEMSFGAYAEYICLKEKGLVSLKPKNMSFEEASTVPYGGMTAMVIFRNMGFTANKAQGKKILIVGASGSIGSYAVQFAKQLGAQVTGVCSTARMEYVKSLGANKVIDYTKEDFTKDDETYDIILDVLGKGSFSKSKKILNEKGLYVVASFKMKRIFQMLWTKIFSSRKLKIAMASYKQEDLTELKELIEAGKIKSIVDKTFPMDEAADAHSYIEDGKKKGHIVITIS